jgi:protein TonB
VNCKVELPKQIIYYFNFIEVSLPTILIKFIRFLKAIMKNFSLIILFLSVQVSFSQSNKQLSVPNPDEVIYTNEQVTTIPQFVGGTKALDKFILRNYKQPIKTIKGEVLVSFIVEKDGSLSEFGVLSDAGKGTADEAIRVMTLSPKWIAGILNGNLVRVQYLLTIKVNSKG